MGGVPEPACPACGQQLHATALAGVSVRVCGQRHGTLLAQADMIPLLEAMSVELLKAFDPDTPLEAVRTPAETVPCPACSRAMVRDDYCSAGLAHFDRCETCHLLWLGNAEIGTMTLMWARMEKRLARTQQQTREALAEVDDFVTNVQLGDHLAVERKTPEAFVYVLGDRVGGFLAGLLRGKRQ